MHVKHFFDLHISIISVVNDDIITYAYLTPIPASNPVNDDITN